MAKATNRSTTASVAFLTTKPEVRKNQENEGQTGSRARTGQCLRKGVTGAGGGGGMLECAEAVPGAGGLFVRTGNIPHVHCKNAGEVPQQSGIRHFPRREIPRWNLFLWLSPR